MQKYLFGPIFALLALSACGGGGSTGLAGGALPAGSGALPTGGGPNIAAANLTPSDSAAASAVSNFQAHFYKTSSHPGSITPSSPTYPGDVTYLGGAVLVSSVQHPIYLNCPNGTCWGNPAAFLTNLGSSTMIHIADEYIGAFYDNRYLVGNGVNFTYAVFTNVLSLNEILGIVHASAVALQNAGTCNPCTGYSHMYHVFLPQGTDHCFNQTDCYSPDNPRSNVFCAYHSSGTFGDIGHVIFTVEPYQVVPGCAESGPLPNGVLIDSTSNTLSHEIFETITDPDGNGWKQVPTRQEIGDECQFVGVIASLNGTNYQIQKEYSNNYHACIP